MEVIHNLFTQTYLIFSYMLTTKDNSFDVDTVLDGYFNRAGPGLMAICDDGGPLAICDEGMVAVATGRTGEPNEDRYAAERVEQMRYRRNTIEWCKSGRVSVDCVQLCATAFLHSHYFYQHIYLSSLKWERDQRKAQVAALRSNQSFERDYRLTIAYDAKYEVEFVEKSYTLMASDEAFDSIPVQFRNEIAETHLFQALVAGTARMHEEINRCKNYPEKLFAALKHPHLHDEVDQDRKCKRRLDIFSYKFLKFHNGSRSRTAKNKLRALSVRGRRDSIAIERGNSVLRRFTLGWAAQCRIINLLWLNAHWLRKFASTESSASQLWQDVLMDVGKTRKPRPDNEQQQDHNEPPTETSVQNKRRKMSAWNMFTREKRIGVPAAEQMDGRKLSAEWAQYTAEQKAPYQLEADRANIGLAAGNAHPLGKRKHRSEAQNPLGNHSLNSGEADNLVLAVPTFTTNRWKELDEAFHSWRKHTIENLHVDREAALNLRDYNSTGGRGREFVDSSLKDFGAETAKVRGDFDHCPTGHDDFAHVEFHNKPLIERAKSLVTQKGDYRHIQLTRNAIMKVYGEAQAVMPNVAVTHVTSKAVDPPRLQQHLCHFANMCVCNAEGVRRVKIRNNIYTTLGKVLPVGQLRDKLGKGEIVMVFRGTKVDGSCFDGGAQHIGSIQFIGDYCYSPLQFMPHEMEVDHVHGTFDSICATRPGDPSKLVPRDLLRLKTRYVDRTDWFFLTTLDTSVIWDVVLFEVVYLARVVGCVRARFLTVRPVDDLKLHRVWDPRGGNRGLSAKELLSLYRLRAQIEQLDRDDDIGESAAVENELICDVVVEHGDGTVVEEAGEADEVECQSVSSADSRNGIMPGEGGISTAGGSSSSMDVAVAAVVCPPCMPSSSSGSAGVVTTGTTGMKKQQPSVKFKVEDYGWIVYYESSGFYAYCHRACHDLTLAFDDVGDEGLKFHSWCRKPRIGEQAQRTARGNGRPLGFLMCWLMEQEDFDDTTDHLKRYSCSSA